MGAFGSQQSSGNDAVFVNTGYEQFHRLSEFLQYYAFLSKKPKNKDLRLVLDLVKDNQQFIVTPKAFTLTRTQDSPLEYRYSISLEAWKRIAVEQSGDIQLGKSTNDFFTSNFLSTALSNVQKAFAVIAAAQDIISAVRGDINRLVQIVQDVTKAIKNIVGIVASLIDLPGTILGDLKTTLGAALQNLQDTNQTIKDALSFYQRSNKIPQNSDNSWINNNITSTGGANGVLSAGTSTSNSTNTNNSTPNGASQNYTSNPGASQGNLLAYVYSNPLEYFQFFAAINVTDITIPTNISSLIQNDLTRVASLRRKDFEDYRNYVNLFSRDIATYFGHGSTTLDAIKGYVGVNPPAYVQTLSRQEMDILIALRTVAQTLDQMAAQDSYSPNGALSSFDFVGKLLNNTGIAFNASPGKYAVPVPYGAAMQDIAAQYLGNPDRVNEIIILNNLRAPFIDENGTTQLLLSNGNGNTFNIATKSNIYIGANVILSSATVPQFSRNVTNIRLITSGNHLVTVDGPPTLGTLLASQKAQIQSFLPGTVSSRNLIYIPSPIASSETIDRLKPIPAFNPDTNQLLLSSKIDIALGSNNDIIFSGTGDAVLIGGLANINQALSLKFQVPLGELNRHPGYGFGIPPGTPNSEINFSDLPQIINRMITSDPRFGQTFDLAFQVNGNTLAIQGSATIRGIQSGIVPFSFNLS